MVKAIVPNFGVVSHYFAIANACLDEVIWSRMHFGSDVSISMEEKTDATQGTDAEQ